MSGIQNVSVTAAQPFATVSPQSQQALQSFANVDLTEAQRTQLRSIFTAAKQNGTSQADVAQQVNAVLTPTQQQTLASDIKAHGFHHHAESATSSTPQATTNPDDATAATSSASPNATILDTITNIQNQAAAAQSTLIDNLQKQVLATNEDNGTT